MSQHDRDSAKFEPKSGTSYDPASGLPLEIVCLADGMEMVLVPAGNFKMGTSVDEWHQFAQLMEPWVTKGSISAERYDKQYFSSEMPQRHVYLDTFYIDKYEVTNLMYYLFRRETGHRLPLHWSPETPNSMPFGLEYHPVTFVDWNDAWTYARWVGKRLPTEAEWEKASRGTDGRVYPWGDHFDHSRAHYRLAYYVHDLESKLVDNRKRTRVASVDSYPEGASPYGAVDMIGNVWEWVNDWFDPDYYNTGPLINPLRPSEGEYRVVRGGASDYDAEKLRCTFRGISKPAYRDWDTGFRCALTVDENLARLLKSGL